MKRRQALISLLGAAGGAASLARESEAQRLSAEAAGGLLRTLARVEPMPGEEGSVLAFLLSMRPSPSDPETEPAITFVP